MTLLRLILLFMLGAMIRRLFKSGRGDHSQGGSARTSGMSSEAGTKRDPAYTDLTEQGIDDADFEEIP